MLWFSSYKCIKLCKYYVVRQVSIYGTLFDLWRTDLFLCAVDENDQFFFSLVHSLREEKKVSWHSQR